MKWRQIISYLVLIVAWFLIGFFVRGLNILPFDSLDKELGLIRQAGQAISSQSYYDPPPARQMTYSAIRGLLSGIGDKYAEFWEPLAAERYDLEYQGKDAVIGVDGEIHQGQYVVTTVVPGLPAQLAGIQEGDIMIEIDNWNIPQDVKKPAVIVMLRGPIGSTAHLVVQRNGQTLTFDIPRTPSVDISTEIFDSDIAYLRLDRFTTQTGTQMEETVNSLMAKNPKAMIWDLRFNGGGSMDTSRQSLDLFLDEGMAFYAKLRDGTLVPYPTASGDIAEKIPLVVLIGPGTYSAPETVAASIKDRNRGTLIGDTTHGKGSIITDVTFSDGSSIRFTVALALTPVTQQGFEGKGVSPDIFVAGEPTLDEAPVLQAALDYLKQVQP